MSIIIHEYLQNLLISTLTTQYICLFDYKIFWYVSVNYSTEGTNPYFCCTLIKCSTIIYNTSLMISWICKNKIKKQHRHLSSIYNLCLIETFIILCMWFLLLNCVPNLKVKGGYIWKFYTNIKIGLFTKFLHGTTHVNWHVSYEPWDFLPVLNRNT